MPICSLIVIYVQIQNCCSGMSFELEIFFKTKEDHIILGFRCSFEI